MRLGQVQEVGSTVLAEPGTDQRKGLRAAMARELHDGPIRELTTCVLRLESFRLASPNPDMQLAISEVEGHARAALMSLRHIISDLRDEPPEEDVASTILAMVERHRKTSNAEFSVVISPTWPELLPGPPARHVARIVQEAVNNAITHSRASHVLIELRADRDHLEAIVSDDGRGIQPGVRDGSGITGMRERAVLLGGRLTVTGRHPGTTIRLDFPIP